MKRFTTTFLALCLLPLSLMANEQTTIPAGNFQMGCSQEDTDCENDEGVQGGISGKTIYGSIGFRCAQSIR